MITRESRQTLVALAIAALIAAVLLAAGAASPADDVVRDRAGGPVGRDC